MTDFREAEARVKELEQELLWATDACEKAEAELQSLQRLNYLNVKAADSETARAEKAEAELADAKKVYEAHASEAERQIDELQSELLAEQEGK